MSSRGIELLKDHVIQLPQGPRARLLKKRAIGVLKVCRKKLFTDWWESLVHAVFGLTLASLAILLILLYAGVPIVGS